MKIGDIFGAGEVSGLIKEVIQRIAPDKEKAAEMELKLIELEQSGELAKMANETEIYKVEVDDRKSARTIHTGFVDVLAVSIIIGSTWILYQVLFGGVAEKISDMVAGMIIGLFVSSITQVLNYYFGSSSGSKAKNDAISNILKDKK